MNGAIGTKAGLLAAVADGQSHKSWEFEGGTLGWAKREGLVEAGRFVKPVEYVITARGRRVYEGLSICTRPSDKVIRETIEAAREEERLAREAAAAEGQVQS